MLDGFDETLLPLDTLDDWLDVLDWLDEDWLLLGLLWDELLGEELDGLLELELEQTQPTVPIERVMASQRPVCRLAIAQNLPMAVGAVSPRES